MALQRKLSRWKKDTTAAPPITQILSSAPYLKPAEAATSLDTTVLSAIGVQVRQSHRVLELAVLYTNTAYFQENEQMAYAPSPLYICATDFLYL